MNIVEMVRTIFSARPKLLRRLAAIGGESERLAASIERHARMSDAAGFEARLAAAAAAEAADAQALRTLLLAHDTWPQVPGPEVREGANHWARISSDLAAEVELVRSLNTAVAAWEGVDSGVAHQLREMVVGKDATLAVLRDLALKCDPQALD